MNVLSLCTVLALLTARTSATDSSTCYADGGGKDGRWSKCKFPFTYKGKVYNRCVDTLIDNVECPKPSCSGSSPSKSIVLPNPYTRRDTFCFVSNAVKYPTSWGYCNCVWDTEAPTDAPTTHSPTAPTSSPTDTPTTHAPTDPTAEPTIAPTFTPTGTPSFPPTPKPIRAPGVYVLDQDSVSCAFGLGGPTIEELDGASLNECKERCDWHSDPSNGGRNLCDKIFYKAGSLGTSECIILRSTGCKQLSSGPYARYTRTRGATKAPVVTSAPTREPTIFVDGFQAINVDMKCYGARKLKSSQMYLNYKGNYINKADDLKGCEFMCAQIPGKKCQRFFYDLRSLDCALIDDSKCNKFAANGRYTMYERILTRPPTDSPHPFGVLTRQPTAYADQETSSKPAIVFGVLGGLIGVSCLAAMLYVKFSTSDRAVNYRERFLSTRLGKSVSDASKRMSRNQSFNFKKQFNRIFGGAGQAGGGARGALPEGWKEYSDNNTGKKYYYNATTKETTWKRPMAKTMKQTASSGEDSETLHIKNAPSIEISTLATSPSASPKYKKKPTV